MHTPDCCKAAKKACVACRDLKRKCDRLLPTCSLCHRLGRRCHYGTRSSPKTNTSIVLSSASLQIPPVAISPISILKTQSFSLQPNVDDAITGHLRHAVGDVSAIQAKAVKYFESVHHWYPILSEISYYERLTSTFTHPSAEYSLLSLSMALITCMPQDDVSFSSLYMLVKSTIAIVEAANLFSLETVQARLLVTLFEVGHAIEPAAFVSLAATTRAAVSIGLNRRINEVGCHDEDLNSRTQTGLRVWWGLVILDRNYTLERGEGPCATHGYESPQYLPRDGSIWDNKILSSSKPLSLDTPSTVRIGGFARQAQVSHVLQILTTHLRDAPQTSLPDAEETTTQIARTLAAFSMLLPEETPQPWPMYCGATGICISALMTLHESRLRRTSLSEEYLSNDAPESMKSSLQRVKRICTMFNARIEQVSIDAMSPFPSHGLIRAAVLRVRLFEETGDEEQAVAAESLTLMVRHFSRRWRVAGKLLKTFEQERKIPNATQL